MVENTSHFGARDFEDLSPLETAQIIQNFIQEGVAAMVEKQDWLVDRLAPPFINPSELVRYISNLPGKPNVLHLGMGDGTANEYFKRNAREHVSFSFADRVYIDPRDLIAAFIEKETGQADETTAAVAAVLRSELLIPASITDVTSGFGMEAKFADFAEKDSVIRKVRAQNLAEALAHGIPESFGNLRTLTSIVTDQPALLLPENDDFRRHITPLGSNLEQVFPIGKDQQTLLRDIANAPRRFFPKDSRAASEIMFKRLQAMFANCDQIIRDDFRNAKTHFPQESDVRLQLVEGSRSDAFLQGDVYDFIDYMRTVLDEEDGLYISDGVVGAYSYRLYYKELNKFLEALPSDMAVDFYIRDEEPKETPPVYLAGIRVYPKANAERVNDIKARKGYQVIDLGQLRENSMALKQMAWTFLYDQVIDYNHRQSFDYIDIDSIPANLIDELVSEIEKKYGPLLFSNFEDAEFL